MTSLNKCQKMCSQTRNSCAKAFDNRSRSKNLKPKNRGGGDQFGTPLKASRVNPIDMIFSSYYELPLYFQLSLTTL